MAKSTSTRNSNTWETGTCKRPEQEATPPSERVGPRAKESPRAAVNISPHSSVGRAVRAGVRLVPPSGRRLPLRRARGARWARGALVKAVWSRDTRIDGGRMRERRTQLKLRRTGGAILQRNAAQHRCARSHSEDGGSGNPFAFSRGGQAEFLLISGQHVGHV